MESVLRCLGFIDAGSYEEDEIQTITRLPEARVIIVIIPIRIRMEWSSEGSLLDCCACIETTASFATASQSIRSVLLRDKAQGARRILQVRGEHAVELNFCLCEYRV